MNVWIKKVRPIGR